MMDLQERTEMRGNLISRVHNDSSIKLFCTDELCKKEIPLEARYVAQQDCGSKHEFPFCNVGCYDEEQTT